MNRYLGIFIGSLAAALCAPAGAADTRTVPLKGEIRLSPGSVRATPRPVRAKIEQISNQFSSLKSNAQTYENYWDFAPSIYKSCSSKAYSVQDQKAAGCSGNQSLDQCMDKLYKHCVANWSIPAPVVSKITTKDLTERAQAAAAMARNLSQVLSQYALEAEQNAKSLAP